MLSENRLVTVQEFRKIEPAFKSDFSVYNAARQVPGFPRVYVGRRLFIDAGRWQDFKASGGAALAGGWRKDAAS